MLRFLVGTLLVSGALGAGWDYNDTASWKQSHPDHCNGSAQSPIDIDTSVLDTTADYGDFMFSIGYKMDMIGKLKNDGHSLKYTVDPKYQASIRGGPVGDNKYILAQYHFHWGSHPDYASSEHTFNGRHYAAEIHFVHYSANYTGLGDALASGKSDALAVVGVFLDMRGYEGMGPRDRDIDINQLLNDVENHADEDRSYRPDRPEYGYNWHPRSPPRKYGMKKHDDLSGESDSIRNLIRAAEETSRLPIGEEVTMVQTLSHWFSDIDHLGGVYHYDGSLTTPTCNEAVQWILLDRPLSVPQRLIDTFRLNRDANGARIEDNHREVQPLNGRTIYLWRP